jgi:hypothetical protein
MDEGSVPPLTPKAGMIALTRGAVDLEALQGDIELTRLALVGALREANDCHVPLEDLPDFCKEPLDHLMSLYTTAGDVANLVRDAGLALLPLVGEHPEGNTA